MSDRNIIMFMVAIIWLLVKTHKMVHLNFLYIIPDKAE